MYKNIRPIAILLAAYNAEKYLAQQIDSLLVQTNQDWTLYIRDDASKDNTVQIIETYTREYPDKILEIDKGQENLGCKDNFFRLLKIVESEYYMFCDADDYWLPEKIELSFKMLKEKELLYKNKPLIVHTDKVITDSELNVIQQSAWRSARFNPDLFLDFKYIPKCIVGGASAIFNHKVKEFAAQFTPFSEASHDGWLAVVTSKYGRIFTIHQPLMLYRQHGANVTVELNKLKRSFIYKIINIRNVMEYHKQFHKDINRLEYGCFIKYLWFRLCLQINLIRSKITYK